MPETEYLLTRNGREVIGRSVLRHALVPILEHEGGNIGYGIRLSERQKGYGTWILALTLEQARVRPGLKRVLVTCDTGNVASARIIEKNHGRFENEVISYRTGKPVSRYWIEPDGSQVFGRSIEFRK